VILMDYFLVMTFLCASVVIYHNFFEMKAGCCCACCECAEPGSRLDWWLCFPRKLGGCERLCTYSGLVRTTTVAQGGGPETVASAKPLYIRIFEDIFPFNLFIYKKVPRLLSILGFLALLAPSIHAVTRLEPQTSAEQFLPASHPFQRFYTTQNAFPSSREDVTVEMQFTYGFDPSDPIDLGGTNRLFNPEAWGTPRYSPSFTLDPAAQLALIDDCQTLSASSLVKLEYVVQTQASIKRAFCWINAFQAYRQCMGLAFPVPVDAGSAVLEWVSAGENATCPEEAWPYGRRAVGDIEMGKFDYTADLGWVRDGSVGIRLAWTRLRVDSNMKERSYLPAATLRVEYDQWEALLATVNAAAPASLGSAMQIASKTTGNRENKWLHMLLQETYVRMAMIGITIGLSIAYIVLLLATRNLIVATLSILTIGCALCCVIASIVWKGWQLGSAESLSMMILTGFAVDYVVHLSHAYMESKAASRVERVHDALRTLGISVFWGMVTSVIAAYTLSTLQLQFFSKFGTFFLFTIFWAYLWAVLFLMPLLAFIGPEGVGPHAVAKADDKTPA